MRISYNEFHISKKVRDVCNFNKGLFASCGNVVFANLKNVRDFQLLYNDYIKTVTKDENKKVSAGQLNAMGLIDEILHYVCMLYRKNVDVNFTKELLDFLCKEFSAEQVDSLLLDFIKEFPPVEVYNEKCSAQEYLQQDALDKGTNVSRSNREQTLEEMILLHLANENQAFKPFLLLFSDKSLNNNKLYSKTWIAIQKFAATKPSFGPFNHDLINLLKEPQVFAPDSLRGQLEYIQKYWDEFLGEWLKRILQGIDTISEEEKAMWQGFGGGNLPDMQPYSFENLMNEYERFSPDKDWMPNVILIAKTVLVWLDQLTKQYGYPITRLDQIPDSELDNLRDQGFTGLWLIGLWERSKASKRIKQICGNPEAAASAYSLFDYNIAQNIGGWDALSNLRTRLWQRGIRLASDMVPNHTGMDGDWVMNRPDLFIQRRDCPFPHYTFNGENLSQDSRTSLYLEDHYYSKNDCSVVFKRVDNQTGDVRYIYHGNDGTGLPWNDTAQIDFLNPEAREAVMQEILHVAQNFPIIRFDAAMVLAKKSIRRLWYPEPGHGGDIATRSETGLSTQQFNDAIPNEFWREVVDRVAKECPDTLLLAEAFWMMEGYFVRTLGMHRVYNSAFMNMLKKEENQKYRDTVKNTINFDPQILKRYVNFMNNPDEETAIAQFGDGDKYFGVCTLMITMPGLPMFGHGQIEGYTEKYGMEYTKAYKDEKPNSYLVDRHWKEIFPLMKKRYLFSGVENFLFYDLWQDNFVNENVFAYSNGCGNERTFVVYNNKYERAYGWIKNSDPFAVKTGNGDEIKLITKSISEGLNLNAEDDKYCIFRENKSNLWYIRKSKEICEKGLFVMLNGFEYQVYMDVQEVTDTQDHRYKILCEFLNGSGCEDIETAWQELIYKDLYAAFAIYAKKIISPLYNEFNFIEETDTKEKEITKESEQKKNLKSKKIKIDFENVSKIIKSAQKEYEDFELECNKILQKEEIVKESKISIVKSKSEFTKINETLKKIIEILNLPLCKKPEDLQKTLLKATDAHKFIQLVLQSNKDLEIAFVMYALVYPFVKNGIAFKCNFARKIAQFTAEEKLQAKDLRLNLFKLFLLGKEEQTNKLKDLKQIKEYCNTVVQLIFNSEYKYLLGGVNNFDNVVWFNKERTDESINYLLMLMLFNSKETEVLDVFKMYKTLMAEKLKAAYKCENILKAFSPAKKKGLQKKVAEKSTKIDKTSKKVSKTKTKKASCKKSDNSVKL